MPKIAPRKSLEGLHGQLPWRVLRLTSTFLIPPNIAIDPSIGFRVRQTHETESAETIRVAS
jgi:hypothetical protein